MTFSDVAKSFARTVVPYLVGLAISLALRAGVDLHGYTAELTFLAGSVYYFLVRVAEYRLSPVFGWLLGVATTPIYRQVKPAAKPVKKTAAKKRLKGDAGLTLVEAIVCAVVVLAILVLLGVLHR